MNAKIKQHGSIKMFLTNLVLLGVAGAVLMRLIAFTFYYIAPATYFLNYVSTAVPEQVEACRIGEDTAIPVENERSIYPYLHREVVKHQALEASVTDEIVRVSDNRVIDITHADPVYEWRKEGRSNYELQYDTVLLPGEYRIESTIIIKAPLVGSKKPIFVTSNTFTIIPCTK